MTAGAVRIELRIEPTASWVGVVLTVTDGTCVIGHRFTEPEFFDFVVAAAGSLRHAMARLKDMRAESADGLAEVLSKAGLR